MLSDLRQQVGELIRAEIHLARVETTRNAKAMGKDAALIAGGGALAYAGFLTLLSSAVGLLSGLLPRWLSSLLVGCAAIASGAALAQRGRQNLARAEVMPDQTVDTIKGAADRMKDEFSVS
jgi:hypothetical protein